MAQLSIEEKRDVLKSHFLLQHLRDWDLELLARHSRQLGSQRRGHDFPQT